MKKLDFPLCSQNLLRIDEYAVHSLQILTAWTFFCFCHLTGNITISVNCRARIYKSHMQGHFCFCGLTIFWRKCR